jgi:spermidine/putrescine transport system ATP-binding protein
LLLDEPLTALDAKLRKEMRGELRTLQKKLGITFVYVTHDQEEAITMSDRVAGMNKGIIEQIGSPSDLFLHPESNFSAEFIGDNNIFEGQIREICPNGELIITFESGIARAHGKEFRQEEIVNLYIRPDKVIWNLSPIKGFNLSGRVTERTLAGSFVK